MDERGRRLDRADALATGIVPKGPEVAVRGEPSVAGQPGRAPAEPGDAEPLEPLGERPELVEPERFRGPGDVVLAHAPRMLARGTLAGWAPVRAARQVVALPRDWRSASGNDGTGGRSGRRRTAVPGAPRSPVVVTRSGPCRASRWRRAAAGAVATRRSSVVVVELGDGRERRHPLDPERSRSCRRCRSRRAHAGRGAPRRSASGARLGSREAADGLLRIERRRSRSGPSRRATDGAPRPAARGAPRPARRNRRRPRREPRSPDAPGPVAGASARRAGSGATTRSCAGASGSRARCRTGSAGSCRATRRPRSRWPMIRCDLRHRPGPAARAAVTVRPTRYGRRPAAVRKRVSPSGTHAGRSAPWRGRCGRARHSRRSPGARARGIRPRTRPRAAWPERRRRDVLAVDLADAPARGPDRRRPASGAIGPRPPATSGSSAAGSTWRVDPPRSRYRAAIPSTRTTYAPGGALVGPPVGLATARPRRARRRTGWPDRRPPGAARAPLGRRVGALADRAQAGPAHRRARTAPRPVRRRNSPDGSGRPPPSPGGPGRRRVNPPSMPSAATASRVSTPCRSSRARLRACSRSVGDGAGSRRRRATSGRRPRAVRARSAGRAGGPPRCRCRCRVRFQRSARSGANVSLVTSPAQTRSHNASRTSRSRPATRRGVQLAVERGARAAPGASRIASCRGLGRAVGAVGQPDRPQDLASGPDERDPAVVAAEAAPPDPGDLARAPPARRGAAAGSRGSAPAGRRARGPRPGSADPRAGRRPRRGVRGRPSRGTVAAFAPIGATPCHSGRNLASAAGSTGSTSRRSRASDRRRSSRSTSGSHHSRSAPPGRNSPEQQRAGGGEPFEGVARRSPTGSPQRRAGSARQERPVGPRPAWRAGRPARPTVGPRKAAGMPTGGAIPTPSR